MLHELALFPVRPTRQPGESLAGFICRHFGTNGHWIPKALHDAVATVYRSEDPQQREEAWSLVCRVMGESPEDYRRLWIENRFTLTQAQAASLKRYWQKPTTRHFRLCPECLQATGVHLTFWDLPLVLACPTHRRLLATQCQCGKPIAWANMRPNWTCSCGQALVSLPTRGAPRRLVNTALAIAAVADLQVSGVADSEVQRYQLTQDLRSTYDVLAWLEVLTRELCGSGHAKTPGSPPAHWRVGHALDNWPSGLVTLLYQFMKRWHRTDRSKLMVYLQDASPTQRLLSMLDVATSNAALPPVLRKAMQDILTDVRFAPASRQWIFNPALSVVQRDGQILALRQWWRGLSNWIEISNETIHQRAALNMGFNEITERVSVMLINSLVQAARQATAPEAFRRFATVWPPIPKCADALPAGEFLELIVRQLLGISGGHREYLCELTLNAVGATSARL